LSNPSLMSLLNNWRKQVRVNITLTREEALVLLHVIIPWTIRQRTITFGHLHAQYERGLDDGRLDPRAVSKQIALLDAVIMQLGRRSGDVSVPPISAIVIDSKTREPSPNIRPAVKQFMLLNGVPGAGALKIKGADSEWVWALRYTERAVWDYKGWGSVQTAITAMDEAEFQTLLPEQSRL